MRIGTDAITLGALQAQKRLDVIANNIANVNTPGYKKEEVHFSDFITQTSSTKKSQGTIKETENPFDIALVGDGLLKVKTDQGVSYTRAGNLTVAKDGTLVTQNGLPVLAKTGPIQVKSNDIKIDEKGQVFDANQSVGELDIVKFDPSARLVKDKQGLLSPASDQDRPSPADACTVRQGYLEGANFDMVEEMSQMVDALRSYESYQKALQTANRDLDSQLINKMGSL